MRAEVAGRSGVWCVSPTSTLLLVVKDPSKLGLGADWLWDVKGK